MAQRQVDSAMFGPLNGFNYNYVVRVAELVELEGHAWFRLWPRNHVILSSVIRKSGTRIGTRMAETQSERSVRIADDRKGPQLRHGGALHSLMEEKVPSKSFKVSNIKVKSFLSRDCYLAHALQCFAVRIIEVIVLILSYLGYPHSVLGCANNRNRDRNRVP